MLHTPLAATWTFGPFDLLPDKRLLVRLGAPVPLTPKAFDTLVFLVEHHDRVVTKDELLEALWAGVTVEEGNLTQQIFLLRKALDDSSEGQQYIATIPRVGYRFVAAARASRMATDSPQAVKETIRRRISTSTWILAAALVLTTVAAATLVMRWRRTPAPPEYTFRQLTADPGVESFPSLSPDGLWFVYASGPIDYPGPSRLYLRRVGQDSAIPLSGDAPSSDTQPAISPDGEWIAFRSERLGGGLFRIPSMGGHASLIVNEGYNPSWSPDGKRIVYSTFSHGASPYARRNGGELRIVDVLSGERTSLKTGEALQPSWSPHGDRIAYWGGSAIYTIAPAGGSPTLVTGKPVQTPSAYNWNPAWTPDGRYLYFSSNRGGTIGLWRLPVEERTGTPRGEVEPVSTPSTFAAHVSFARRAPDRFLFASFPTQSAIQRLQFDPQTETIVGEPTRVTKDLRGYVWPEPSPDGQWLVCQSDVSKMREDIYVGNADGTMLHPLTNDEAPDRAARWSRDGTQIAFYSGREGNDTTNIWVVNVTGNELHQVTFSTNRQHVMWPVWAPDGKHMAASGFGRGAFVFDLTRPWDLAALQFLGPADDKGTRMQAWSWSSDGARLAGGVAGPGRGGVLVYSFATKSYERLTDFGSAPVWLNDDRRLLFGFEDRLFVVDSRTKITKEVAVFPRARVDLINGGGFSITKDNRTIYVTPIVREGDIWMATVK
jgi:eukaryotic-like serine/threonine-protein kinase